VYWWFQKDTGTGMTTIADSGNVKTLSGNGTNYAVSTVAYLENLNAGNSIQVVF
jgi:hypothetical protein